MYLIEVAEKGKNQVTIRKWKSGLYSFVMKKENCESEIIKKSVVTPQKNSF